MVNTRGSLRREITTKREAVDESVEQQPGVSPSQQLPTRDDPVESKPQSIISGTNNSKKSRNQSCSSSTIARRKQLELEAAQEKARIQMELIDKKLAADVAALMDEDKYSSRSKSVHSKQSTSRSDIERWIDRSPKDLRDQRVHEPGIKQDPLYPPEKVCSGTDGSVQQLATALQQLVTSTVTNNQNSNLLSRISTPRDLPIFLGDAMEFLHFQLAYEESTELCKFNDKENIWRLRRCLRGPAREAVASLLMTPTTPDKIMDTLKLQFGNPDNILCKILGDIKKLNPLPPDYHKDITKFSIKITNYVTAVRSLGRDDYLQGVNVATIVLSKLPTVLISKWNDYSYEQMKKENKCRLSMLSDFLHEEAVKLSQSGANLLYLRPEKRQFNNNSETVLMQDRQSVGENCRFCKKSVHKLIECKKFKKALRKERWDHVKRSRLCFKCLLSHHDKLTCPAPVCDAESCGKNHHRLLHYVPRRNVESAVVVPEPMPESHAENVNYINANSCAVILKVVPIFIHGDNGVIRTTALLDDGSTVSLISAELADRAGLRGRRECLRVRGAWDSTELVCDSQLVSVPIANKQGKSFNIIARSVSQLDLPKQDLTVINCNRYKHLESIKNQLCFGNLKPEVLIGQDNYHLLLPLESIVGSPKEPCATRTPLGWCVHGRASITRQPQSHSTLFISDSTSERELRELHDEVRYYFSLESMGISATPRQNAEDIKALDILERTSTLKDGKWHVGLPWKNEDCKMPDNFPTAISRLKGVEQKMKRNQEYAERYRERIQHLFDNGYAEQLEEEHLSTSENKRIWYLPHFCVDNPNKKKLRLVFDAAAKTAGLSLNDYLLKGPDLLQSLFGIMLRFRENRVALTADIQDMFLRVQINPDDQDVFRFLFRDNNGDLKKYVMKSLVFGCNCSPFVAQFVKNKNAERFRETMPGACDAIIKSHYMDDYIDSVPDEQTAVQLVNDVTHIHSQGNFYIRSWTTNNETVLNSIPKEALGEVAVRFKTGLSNEYQGERTLGLIWEPQSDLLN